jgi:hypothetical protein
MRQDSKKGRERGTKGGRKGLKKIGRGELLSGDATVMAYGYELVGMMMWNHSKLQQHEKQFFIKSKRVQYHPS